MQVTAALAWWDEPPDLLRACVEGVGKIADRLVAFDGAYARYPGATILSPPKQAETIRQVAAKVGIEVVIFEPDRLWAGQVEKRTALLRAASEGSDWIVVVDADHLIDTNRNEARAALEAMPEKVRQVGVDFFTPENPTRDITASAATNWHRNVAGTTLRMVQIVRAMEDYRVVKKHWIYEGIYRGERTEVRFGGPPDAWIGVPYVVTHLTLLRSEDQVLASRAFLNDREMVVRLTGQEDDVAGLPEPAWDYETMPYQYQQNVKVVDSVSVEPVAKKAPFDEPLRVLTLGEAAHALKSGYQKVLVRNRGSQMKPELPDGDYVLLEPAEITVGDITLARVRGKLHLQRVTAVADDRYLIASERGLKTGWSREAIGVVTWHGPKVSDYTEPKAEVSLRKDTPPKPKAPRKPRAKKAETAAVPKRRGRPPKAKSPA